MTRSCRSWAIRSLSSRIDRRSASARLASSSSATPAWAANEATTSAWAWGNGAAPWRRPTVSTPRTLPGTPSGNSTAGPIWLIAPRAAWEARSSAAKSADVTGSPVASTWPDREWPADSTRPRVVSEPSPSARVIVSPRPPSSGTATTLSRQGQVAEHLVADPQRHAEKAAHRRVPVGEARRCRVRGDVGQAERAGIVDQQAEQAAAFGPVMDPRDLALAQADRDELGQPQFPAVLVADDAECAVGGVHQADRGLDDPPEGGLQVQAGPDGDDRLEQTAQPVPGRQHRLQPVLQFGEQLVELQMRKQLRASLGFRHQVLPRTMRRKDIGLPQAADQMKGGS